VLQEYKVYLLDKPESKKEVDLARPGYWELIQFDEAPFMFQGKTKIIENGNTYFKYSWAEWVIAGYIDSVEHIVPASEIDQYEIRWKDPEPKWLKTVQQIIFNKLTNLGKGVLDEH
jgi:hypothetical protein